MASPRERHDDAALLKLCVAWDGRFFLVFRNQPVGQVRHPVEPLVRRETALPVFTDLVLDPTLAPPYCCRRRSCSRREKPEARRLRREPSPPSRGVHDRPLNFVGTGQSADWQHLFSEAH